jgi:sigma-B regulation protein RsbU (phosphoserine phosphatase)
MDRNNNMYFTIWYGVYHAPTRSLRHASGGHPPAFLLLPDGEIEELNQPGLVIGYMTGVPYSSATRIVPPNSKLLVLCDGTYEVKKPDGNMLEFSEFKAFMKSNGAAPDVFKKLLDWLHSMNGPGPLDDDFSLIRILFP